MGIREPDVRQCVGGIECNGSLEPFPRLSKVVRGPTLEKIPAAQRRLERGLIDGSPALRLRLRIERDLNPLRTARTTSDCTSTMPRSSRS